MRNALSFLFAAVIGLSAFASSAQVDKKIERTWKSKCASCHGVTGNGDTETGKKSAISDFTKPEWQKAMTDAVIKKAILEGVKREKKGVQQEMDGYKEKGLDDAAADGLVKYVRGLK
jgi:mono/diheme cytochrome c family protein